MLRCGGSLAQMELAPWLQPRLTPLHVVCAPSSGSPTCFDQVKWFGTLVGGSFEMLHNFHLVFTSPSRTSQGQQGGIAPTKLHMLRSAHKKVPASLWRH